MHGYIERPGRSWGVFYREGKMQSDKKTAIKAVNYVMDKMAERCRKGLPGPARDEFSNLRNELLNVILRNSTRPE
jgi:hypothetical protein